MANIFEDVWAGIQKGVVDAADAVAKGAADGWNAVQNAAGGVANAAIKVVDQNGDGKFDQEDVMIILGNIYQAACNGIPNIDASVERLSSEYLKQEKDEYTAARKMIDNTVLKCTTSGFINGFGGLITLPITIPANVSSVLYLQMRMIASVAYMAGLDVRSDTVQSLVYACLAGVSIAEVIKKAGIQFGNKLAVNLVKKIPRAVLVKINQKVGFRFLTKFGEKGIVNVGKMVPVVGAVINGGFDLLETRVIGDRAYKQFMESDFRIDNSTDEIVTEE